MAVVVGFLVSVVIATLILWAVAGRRFTVDRDPHVNLGELAGRHTGILSGLGGFAVTGMVLLVTLGRNLPDTSSTAYTTVLMMFFVSWMAYAGCAFLFANIVDSPGSAIAGRAPNSICPLPSSLAPAPPSRSRLRTDGWRSGRFSRRLV